ncbi:MAG TPA: DinB family protein [Dehalococcoidia bacterium]|nr:DinB family protein [Dehalococcoidia bacterium]
MATPLISRLLIDAQTEFARAIEHVPGPARGRAIGRLNTATWAIAHTTEFLDYWINVDAGGGDRDPRQAAWGEAQDALPKGDALPTSYDEAAQTFARVAERATVHLESWDEADLREVVHEFAGSSWEGTTRGYLVARSVAHLFAHAGELSVIASLVLWDERDLGLPGELEWSLGAGSEAVDAGDLQPAVVRLLLDAREQFVRVADALPVPAQAGAFDRLNAGSWIVAHIAEQDDQYWSVHARQLDADPWLAGASVKFGDPESRPDYAEARAALDRSFERSQSYIEGLDGTQFDTVLRRSRIPERGDQTAADLVVLQAAHLFALAGELAAIGSLAGADDPGLPGRLAHVTLGNASAGCDGAGGDGA